MNLFILIIGLSIFSLEASADSIFETVALNSEYLVMDTQTEIRLLGSLSNGYKIFCGSCIKPYGVDLI